MNKFPLIDLIRRTSVNKYYKHYSKTLNSPGQYNQVKQEHKINLGNFLIKLKSNKYYSDFLNKYNDKYLRENCKEVLKKLPVMNKQIINDNRSDIFDFNHDHEKTYTGGSTGSPFKYLIDKKSISRQRAFNYALWNHFLNYSLGDRVLVIGGSSITGKSSYVKKVYNYLQNKDVISGGRVEVSQVNNIINKVNKCPLFIYGYPSSLVAYIKALSQSIDKIRVTNVKGVICTSEMLSEENKNLIEAFFKTEVLNIYGANDGGIMSGSIDNHEFIYNGVDCYVENHTNSNGMTELLLTNLNSLSTPFVRYQVGDIAEIVKVHDKESYPFIIRDIQGRTRDLIHLKNGEQIHGSFINKVLKKFSYIQQYQLIQNKDYSCNIYIELNKNQNDHYTVQEAIKKEIQSVLTDVPIEVNVTDKIHPKDGTKLINIVSHVQ